MISTSDISKNRELVRIVISIVYKSIIKKFATTSLFKKKFIVLPFSLFPK